MVTAFSGAYTLELRRRSNLATFPILPTFTMLRTLVLLVCVALASAFQPVMSTGVLRSAITATDVSPLMLVRLRDTREPAPTPGPTPLSATPSLHAYRPPAACIRVPLPRASIGVPPTAPPCAFTHAAPHLPTSHHPATPPRLFVLLPRSPLRVLHVPLTLLRHECAIPPHKACYASTPSAQFGKKDAPPPAKGGKKGAKKAAKKGGKKVAAKKAAPQRPEGVGIFRTGMHAHADASDTLTP
eukprot:scaffold86727_cov60-Phaeocystis_antarctica.AAC.6